jgi:sugar lactone lactonase YvrE
MIRGLEAPEGLAFDGSGNLWVVDGIADQLEEFTTTQLLVGGTATPATIVSLAGLTAAGETWTPLGLAIDSHGNFWIGAQLATPPLGSAADSAPSYVVAEFAPAAADTGNPAPVLVLLTQGIHPAGYGPGVTFDRSGNLWTTNAAGASVTEFSADAVTAGGANVTPALTITGSGLTGTADLRFDGNAVLFVGGSVNAAGGTLYGYSPSTIQTSGAPKPKLTYGPPSGVNHFTLK